jgi:hypothetical protein
MPLHFAAVELCSHCWRAGFATSPPSTTGPAAAPQAGRRENLKTRLLALLAVLTEAHGEISFRELRRSHGIDKAQVRQLAAVFPQKLTIEKRQAEMGRPSWIVKRSLEDVEKSPHSKTTATFQK